MSRELLRSDVKKQFSTGKRYFKSKKALSPNELQTYNTITRRIKELSSREINYNEAKELMRLRNDILSQGIISYSNPTIKEAGLQIRDFVEGESLEKESSDRIIDLSKMINEYNEMLKSTPMKQYGKRGEEQASLSIDDMRASDVPREKRILQEEYIRQQEARGFEQIPRDVLRERLLMRVEGLKAKIEPSVMQGQMPRGQQGQLTRGEVSRGQIREMETLDPQSIIEPSVLVDRTQEGRLRRGESNIGQIREMETVEPSLLPGYGIAEIQTGKPARPKRLPPRRPFPQYEEEKHDDFGTDDMDGGQKNKQLEDNVLKTEKPLNGPQVLSDLESSIDLFTDLFKMMPENKDIFEFYENLRRQDQNQADELLNDIIQEVEILSGANRDSLFNAQDLKQTPSVNDENGFPLSGQQRGQSARHLTDIDESKLDMPGRNERAGGISLVDVDGVNVWRNKNMVNRPGQEAPGSIEETIRNNIKLSEGWSARYGEQDRGFIRDQYASQDSRSDLMMQSAQKRLNKWNPYMGSTYTGIMRDSGMGDIQLPPETMQMSGDRVVQGGINVPQGVAPLSIERVRAEPSGYRQPDRKYKGNAVELIRQSNRTSQALANEFM